MSDADAGTGASGSGGADRAPGSHGVSDAGGSADTGGRAEHQLQLVCEDCGAIEDGVAVASAVSAVTDRAEATFGFVARAVQVTAFGRCAHCCSDGPSA